MNEASMMRSNQSNTLRNVFQPSIFATMLLACSIVQAGAWKSEPSALPEDLPLCQDLFKHLKMVSDRCWMDAVETYPEFSDPPWEDLDQKEHVELLSKLLRYMREGARWYFHPDVSTNRQPDKIYQNEAARFIATGGTVQVWRTHLMSFYDDSLNYPAAGEEQTVVLLTDKVGTSAQVDDCPGKTSHNWFRRTFIVLPDLSGPEPRVNSGIDSLLFTRWPVLYQGKIRLIGRYDVWRDWTTTGLKPICNYKRIETPARKAKDK